VPGAHVRLTGIKGTPAEAPSMIAERGRTRADLRTYREFS
jgi:hypothetical protein